MLCDDLEGWDGVRWGWGWEGGSRGRGHVYTMVDIWQKPTQYCKAIKNKYLKKIVRSNSQPTSLSNTCLSRAKSNTSRGWAGDVMTNGGWVQDNREW